MPVFSRVLPIISPLLPFASGKRLRHWNEFVHRTIMSHGIHPFCSDVILLRFVYSSFEPWSRAFVGINNTHIFCLAFPNIAVGFTTALYRYFATHSCWHRNFQLSLRAAFIVSLNSSSSGSIKNIPTNCLALSSFGFSIAHLCFAFFFAASDINFHISGHTSSGREVVCFLVSLSPGPFVSFRWHFLQ